jgi:hypothetical protein
VPFSTSLGCGRFSRVLPRHRVLPGSSAPFVPPFGVFRLAEFHLRNTPESFVPCWCTVATAYPLGNCDSLEGRNRLRTTSLNSKRLLIASRRAGSFSRFRRRANAIRGTGESCLSTRDFHRELLRDQTNQPGSIFPRSPGIICDLVDSNFRFDQPHRSFPSSSGRSHYSSAPLSLRAFLPGSAFCIHRPQYWRGSVVLARARSAWFGAGLSTRAGSALSCRVARPFDSTAPGLGLCGFGQSPRSRLTSCPNAW